MDGRGLMPVFSPDGSRLATGVGDKTVRIWDPSTGTELLALEASDQVGEVFFSNDGLRIFVRSQRWWESNGSTQVFEAPAK